MLNHRSLVGHKTRNKFKLVIALVKELFFTGVIYFCGCFKSLYIYIFIQVKRPDDGDDEPSSTREKDQTRILNNCTLRYTYNDSINTFLTMKTTEAIIN